MIETLPHSHQSAKSHGCVAPKDRLARETVTATARHCAGATLGLPARRAPQWSIGASPLDGRHVDQLEACSFNYSVVTLRLQTEIVELFRQCLEREQPVQVAGFCLRPNDCGGRFR